MIGSGLLINVDYSNSSRVVEIESMSSIFTENILSIFLGAIKAKNEQAINENCDQVIQSLKQNSIHLKEYLAPCLEALTDSNLSLETKHKIVVVLRKMSLEFLAHSNLAIDATIFEQWFESNTSALKAQPSLYFECLILEEILWTAQNDRFNLQECWEKIIKKTKGIYFNLKFKKEFPPLIVQFFERCVHTGTFKTTKLKMYAETLEKIGIQRKEMEQKIQELNKKSSADKNNHLVFATQSAELEFYKEQENDLSKKLEHFSSSLLAPVSNNPLENLSIDSMQAALDYLSKCKQERSLSKKRKREGMTTENKNSKKRKLHEIATSMTPQSQALHSLNKAEELQVGEICIINGTMMSKFDLLHNAIHMDPKLAQAYKLFGDLICPKREIYLFNGQKMTKQTLYLKTIELDPSCAAAYFNLGKTLSSGGEITLNDGTKMSQQALFLKAMNLDSSLSISIYLTLALSLPKEGKITLKDVKTGIQQEMNKKELLLKAIELDPSLEEAYVHLGNSLSSKERTTLWDGTEMTQKELYIKAIQLNRNYGYAYLCLAKTLSSTESIPLSAETKINKKELLLKAIELNSSLVLDEAYIYLGTILSLEEKVIFTRTQQQHYLQSIHNNPSLAKARFYLGTTLSPEEEMTLLNGEKVNQQKLFKQARQLDNSLNIDIDCYEGMVFAREGMIVPNRKHQPLLEAIDANPNAAQAYFELSQMLMGKYPIPLLDGTKMNQEQLLLKAISVDPSFAAAYMYLAAIHYGNPLSHQITLLDGKKMDQFQLYCKAMELDPSLTASAYYNIGLSMGSGSYIILNGNKMTQQHFFQEACRMKPSLATDVAAYYSSQLSSLSFNSRALPHS